MSARILTAMGCQTLNNQVSDSIKLRKDEESEIEGSGLEVDISQSRRGSVEIIRPIFVFPCPVHPLNPCKEELELYVGYVTSLMILILTSLSAVNLQALESR
jgi:hypothetical protein